MNTFASIPRFNILDWPAIQDRMNTLIDISQAFEDGLLTADEARQIEEGKQVWQREPKITQS